MYVGGGVGEVGGTGASCAGVVWFVCWLVV